MKTITSSVAFQSPSGVVAANGYLLLTLQQNATLIGGGQIFSTIPTRIKLDATGKIPAGTQIVASDEMVTQIPYTADLQDSNMSRLDTLGTWAIVGASPIDLSLMVSTNAGVSFPGAVMLAPSGNQTILTNNLILALGDFITTVGNATIAGNITAGGTLGVTGLSTLAALTATGNVTETAGQNIFKSYSFNSVLWLDGIKYTTLAGAYADIASTGGIVMVPPNYSETLAADLTLSKPNAGFMFMGQATITMGSKQVIINQALAGCFIVGQSPTGAIPLGSSDFTGNGGVQFIYTGSSTAFVVGGASATPVAGLSLENFAIDISGAGTNTIALNLKNVHGGGHINDLLIRGTGGATNQVGIQCDDGGGFTGDITFNTCQIAHVKQGILFNSASQEMTLLGCQFWGGSTSGIAIDMEGVQWGIQSWGGNIDNYATCVKMASTSEDNYIAMPMGNFTTMANFGASTSRNTVQQLRNVAPTVSDSGTLNNVIWGGTRPGTVINQQGPASAIVGTSSDATLYTYTLPAGMLLPGKGLRVLVSFLHSTGTTSTTYNFKIGGTTISTNSYANFTTADGSDDTFEFRIFNNAGVQNAQNFFKTGYLNVAGQTLMILAGPVTGTSAIDFTASQAISFTFNVANTNQVTPKFWMVELL